MTAPRPVRGRILVIRGGAIGDFILTLPALAALRRQFPDAEIEVLGYPHIARLAVLAGVVDRVQAIEARGLAGFFAQGGGLDPAMAAYFGSFNLILSYLYDPDAIFRTNVAFCTRAQFVQGPHRPPDDGPRHASEVFLEPLERLAIYDADAVPRIVVNLPQRPGQPAAQSAIATRIATLAVHPGSGSERKNWPEARWAGLLDRLVRETSLRLLLVGGEAEGDRLERLAASLPAARVQLVRSRPLDELAHELAGCAAFIGHDSGITHLAAALGVPVLALWGMTNPDVWQPRGPAVRLLRSPQGLAGLTVEEVWREARELLAGRG